jgi:hypothetical protein
VPACDDASITLRTRRGRAETVATTDPALRVVDEVQYTVGEGPCLDAAFETGNVAVPDIPADERWPRWAAAASEQGLYSLLAVRLHTERSTLGALNLYARRTAAFDADNTDVALIYATHATEAMAQARLVSGLQVALEARHTIGIAQGILAVTYGISYERAFEVIHRYSNDHNVKLRDVAQQIVETRHLPDLASQPEPPEELEGS